MTQATIPLGLCQCGCGQRTTISPQSSTRRGYVKGEPRRFIAGHNAALSPVSPVLYVVDEETGCWVWQMAVRRGYGVWKHRPAHRVFYEQFKGPIPDGLHLDHLCRNRACVNPDHLEPVTSAENQRRGDKATLTDKQVREIRARSGWTTQAHLAEMYGVDPSTISLIVSRKRWRDI